MKIKTARPLDEVEAAKPFAVLDSGKYPVRVVNYKDGISKAGNAKVDFELEVAGGQYAGRQLFYNITPGSDAALPFVRQALEAFGVRWDHEGFDPAEFIGKTAIANVEVDISGASPRNTVKTVAKAA